ncbi:MAG: alcohol dehydrogenase catalytic domain-containing protein, partial [Cellvibrionales bacterium]|nr:alcohol dehydrogenase catalytic domain-containing protein [Cellvibrionales bacterium]
MNDYTSYDLLEWGQPFEKCRHPLPKPKGHEVLVKVTAAGLCHSDLHIKKGHMDLGEEGKLTFSERGSVLPRTYGHEVAGNVAAIGPDVTSVKLGQQVLVFPWIGCGDCLACHEDRQSDCLNMRVIGMVQNGGFATHCLVEHEKFLLDIEGLDPVEMVPHACSGSTTHNGLTKIGPLRDGEWLAIMGCGGLGMNAIALARGMGFANIIALDVDDAKLQTALEMGADKT